jgi:hypothetical protein
MGGLTIRHVQLWNSARVVLEPRNMSYSVAVPAFLGPVANSSVKSSSSDMAFLRCFVAAK